MKIEKFESLSDSQISSIEKQLKVTLPEDYKNFLKQIGGGVVEKDEVNKIVIDEIGEEIILDVLYGDNQKNEKGSILFWMEQFDGELLGSSIIIGDDILQGFLVLICDGENKGVYYWDDSYNFETSNDENNMYRVAESFKELLEQISDVK